MTIVALLRGINVGGSGKLPMAELKAAFVAAGAENPDTYIQSGNVVFSGRMNKEGAINEIERRAGFRPAIMLIEGKQFLSVQHGNPFPDAVRDPRSLHVFFLSKPSKTKPSVLLDACGPEESIALNGSVLYLHSPKYLSGSKFAPKAEKLLAVPVTARNWNTVNKLTEMIESRA